MQDLIGRGWVGAVRGKPPCRRRARAPEQEYSMQYRRQDLRRATGSAPAGRRASWVGVVCNDQQLLQSSRSRGGAHRATHLFRPLGASHQAHKLATIGGVEGLLGARNELLGNNLVAARGGASKRGVQCLKNKPGQATHAHNTHKAQADAA